jgi:hypothetical protein
VGGLRAKLARGAEERGGLFRIADELDHLAVDTAALVMDDGAISKQSMLSGLAPDQCEKPIVRLPFDVNHHLHPRNAIAKAVAIQEASIPYPST